MLDKYFYEVFENIPRQGPGSNKETQRAYAKLTHVPNQPEILDIGCGSGIQTVELARLSQGFITALDNHQFFLDELEKSFNKSNIERFRLILGDMHKLPFKPGTFDIIWSEGAIFIIGVEEGLNYWKQFLKPRGYLVFSESCWFKDDPPKELFEFWHSQYPQIKNVNDNLTIIKNEGYEVIDHFHLPDYCWKEEYYDFIEKVIERLSKEKYSTNEIALNTFNYIMDEIRIFNKYSEYYGYEFYILRK